MRQTLESVCSYSKNKNIAQAEYLQRVVYVVSYSNSDPYTQIVVDRQKCISKAL